MGNHFRQKKENKDEGIVCLNNSGTVENALKNVVKACGAILL